MRIGFLLTGGFVLMAAIVGGVGYLSSSSDRAIQDRLERISRTAVVDVVVANELTLAQTEILIAAHELIAEKNRMAADPSREVEAGAEIKKQLAAIETAADAIDRALAQARQARAALRQATDPSGDVAGGKQSRPAVSRALLNLENEARVHRQLMRQFVELTNNDGARANQFLEQEVQRHYSQSFLPVVETFKARAEKEFVDEMREVERALVQDTARNNVAVLLALLTALVLGLAVSRTIGRPLTRMTAAAQAIGQRQLDTRVGGAALGELGVLAAALNQMAANLQTSTVSLGEKEVLLREVHHRVKNNLQIISSLLSMQAAESSDPRTAGLFEESQGRVRAMAVLHELLYRSVDLARIDFSEYLRQLLDVLRQSHHGPPAQGTGEIQLNVAAEPVPLSIEQAIPCGLIVNELVSNALKHAFPANRRGNIWVEFHTLDGKHRLVVRDDGVGMAPEKLEVPNSLGLKIVRALVQQLDGELQVAGEGGTRFNVEFPALCQK